MNEKANIIVQELCFSNCTYLVLSAAYLAGSLASVSVCCSGQT